MITICSAVFVATPRELQSVTGIGAKIAREIKNVDLETLARELPDWARAGHTSFALHRHIIPKAPAIRAGFPADHLCARLLATQEDWEPTIAIVGTRYPSQVAKILTLQLSMKLARAGCTIVSGLALGIDAAAHASALEAGGHTVAVLGSGVLNIYPPQNRLLAKRILESGALVSEAHPRLAPNAQRLVSRNRIISALSGAVIVIESDVDGGAMHTARFAREQGRKVYTFRLPASGNQELMRNGAAVLPSDLDAAIKYLPT